MKKNLFILIVFYTLCSSLCMADDVEVNMEECLVTKRFDVATSSFALTSTSYSLDNYVRIVTNPSEKATFNVCIVKNDSPFRYDVDYFCVCYVKDSPNECGEWKIVNKDEGFSVRFVSHDASPDFYIQIVKDRKSAGGYPARNYYGSNFIPRD